MDRKHNVALYLLIVARFVGAGARELTWQLRAANWRTERSRWAEVQERQDRDIAELGVAMDALKARLTATARQIDAVLHDDR